MGSYTGHDNVSAGNSFLCKLRRQSANDCQSHALTFHSDVLAHMSTLPGSEDPATASNLKATSATQSTSHGTEAGQTRPHVASILSTFPQPSRLPSIARSVATKVRDELHLNPPPLAGAKAPSLTSVFPRFSNADVNL